MMFPISKKVLKAQVLFTAADNTAESPEGKANKQLGEFGEFGSSEGLIVNRSAERKPVKLFWFLCSYATCIETNEKYASTYIYVPFSSFFYKIKISLQSL